MLIRIHFQIPGETDTKQCTMCPFPGPQQHTKTWE